LKAISDHVGFGNNRASLLPLLDNRPLAEAVIERVPSIRIPVYEWVLPPLSNAWARDSEDEDWEMELIGPEIKPMPGHVRYLPARVTAFTSSPWGQVGVYLVLFDEPEQSPRWGMWYLREPSARIGTRFPFFRTGDFDDAELLVLLALKPFMDAQGIVLEDLVPPHETPYLGPWHRLGNTVRFKEIPDWFAKALHQR
jgi:hypothetical protein